MFMIQKWRTKIQLKGLTVCLNKIFQCFSFFNQSPVPKDNVPREKLPMVDPTWFKTRTTIPRQPKALLPVPHGGLKSLYAESFQQPTDVKAKENYYCAVDTPFVLPGKFSFM